MGPLKPCFTYTPRYPGSKFIQINTRMVEVCGARGSVKFCSIAAPPTASRPYLRAPARLSKMSHLDSPQTNERTPLPVAVCTCDPGRYRTCACPMSYVLCPTITPLARDQCRIENSGCKSSYKFFDPRNATLTTGHRNAVSNRAPLADPNGPLAGDCSVSTRTAPMGRAGLRKPILARTPGGPFSGLPSFSY